MILESVFFIFFHTPKNIPPIVLAKLGGIINRPGGQPLSVAFLIYNVSQQGDSRKGFVLSLSRYESLVAERVDVPVCSPENVCPVFSAFGGRL